MNEENLIPFSQRSESEARENGKKGGKASGASRRKKKAMKDCMKQILELPVTDVEQWNALSAMGISPDDINNQMLINVALLKAAAAGDVKAYKEIRHLIGDNETELDKKLKRAQLDKIKAETEVIRSKSADADKAVEENNLIEVLREGAVDEVE